MRVGLAADMLFGKINLVQAPCHGAAAHGPPGLMSPMHVWQQSTYNTHTLCCAAPRSAAAVLPVLVLLSPASGINTTEGGAYFNNVAVAVRAAQHAGARRVMVIDW